MAATKTRILVVDDHPMIRERLVQLIDREPNLANCGQATNGPETLQAIEKLRPDMVILDLSMEGSHGTELIKDIKARDKNVLILVLTMHDESLYAERAIRAGARGYVAKHEGSEKVKEAIRSVLKGELFVSKEVIARILEKTARGVTDAVASPFEALSDRELEVFQLLGLGYGPSEIAKRLHLSVRTVEGYGVRIRGKLNLKGASELVQYAIQLNNWKDSQTLARSARRTGPPSDNPS